MDELVGRAIIAVRPMAPDEMEREGWDSSPDLSRPVAIVFDDETLIYPARDVEGNGPVALFGIDASGLSFRISA